MSSRRRDFVGRLARVALLAGLAVGMPVGAVLPALAEHAPWRPPVRISIVWPHDGQGNPVPVEHSRAVNVSVWPSAAVACGEVPESGAFSARLAIARNNEPALPLDAPGVFVQSAVGGVTFPSLEFNRVMADLTTTAAPQYRFVVYTSGIPIGGGFGSNVWVHAADARTHLPEPVAPAGHATSAAPTAGVDARVQIVWPHDPQGREAAVDEAPLVNVAVDLFEHRSRRSLPIDPVLYSVSLFAAERNGPLQRADLAPFHATAQRVTYTFEGQTYPRWVFNDVRVTPGEQYHFVASALVAGGRQASPHSTIWTHASDPRTLLPHPDPPPPCVP